MTKRLGFLLGIAIVIAVPLQSQTDPPPSISYGSVSVSLDMTKDAVLARLAEQYTLQPSGTSTYVVISKSGPPFAFLGSVTFDAQNRLSSADRGWGPDDQQQGVPLAEALYNGLTQLSTPTQSGSRLCRCTVLLTENVQPQATGRTIYISNGHRRLEVTAYRFTGSLGPGIPQVAASISETIER